MTLYYHAEINLKNGDRMEGMLKDFDVVETIGIEPMTFSLPAKRSPS